MSSSLPIPEMLPYFATSSTGSSRQLAALLEEALKSRSPQRPPIAGDGLLDKGRCCFVLKGLGCFSLKSCSFGGKHRDFGSVSKMLKREGYYGKLSKVVDLRCPTTNVCIWPLNTNQEKKKDDVLRISVWIRDWGMFHQPTKSRSSLKGSKNLFQKQKTVYTHHSIEIYFSQNPRK